LKFLGETAELVAPPVGDFIGIAGALIAVLNCLIAPLNRRHAPLNPLAHRLLKKPRTFNPHHMPITGPASYLPTVELFLNHWQQVNTALDSAGPLVLAGGRTHDALSAQRDELEAARDAVTDAGVERSLARGALVAQVTALQARLVEFNERVRADLPGSPFAHALPTAFSVGDAEGSVRDGLRQVSTLWRKVNAIASPPAGVQLPLTLHGGYTLARFDADRDDLRAAYRALSDVEVEGRLAWGARNALQDEIYDALKCYRMKVPTAVRDRQALIESLPALTPAPGRTPAAVRVQVAWDATLGKARVTWEASTDPDLRYYELRGVPGDDYATDDEAVLAVVAPTAPREALEDFALTAPGLTAGFKVYVVLQTGNEKGSDAVYVTRPA
jgi:hypothetical protein